MRERGIDRVVRHVKRSVICSDGGMGHGILSSWGEERKKAFRQGVSGAPAVTPEQQSSITGTNNNPSLSLSLFSFIT